MLTISVLRLLSELICFMYCDNVRASWLDNDITERAKIEAPNIARKLKDTTLPSSTEQARSKKPGKKAGKGGKKGGGFNDDDDDDFTSSQPTQSVLFEYANEKTLVHVCVMITFDLFSTLFQTLTTDSRLVGCSKEIIVDVVDRIRAQLNAVYKERVEQVGLHFLIIYNISFAGNARR
jgi:hypothetical protein